MDLAALQRDPAEFRRHLKVDADGLTVVIGEVLDDWQRADFEALDSGWQRVAGRFKGNGRRRAWLERPRGHSKTTDIATSVSYALFASKRLIRGVCAAADQDQAALIRKAIDSLCRLNPWLGQVLDVFADKVVNKATGSELEIITSDAASSYGKLVDFVVCDELTHWRSDSLWVSLLSTAAKRDNCMLLVITNAGFETDWQFEIRHKIIDDADWYFSRLDGPVASWITDSRLDEQRRLLPDISFKRLWLNIWGKSSGDALSADDIQAAIVLDGPTFQAEPGWGYCAGLDIGLSRNASALVVLGKHIGVRREHEKKPKLTSRQRMMIDAGLIDEPNPELVTNHVAGTGKLRVAHVSLWKPANGAKVSIESIETMIERLHLRFRFRSVGYDPWQAQYLAERLTKKGIMAAEVPFTSGNLQSMCSVVLEHFRDSQVELFDDEQLVADLGNLRTVAKSYGVRLESPHTSDGQHGDVATAFAIGAHVSKQIHIGWHSQVQGELVCHP